MRLLIVRHGATLNNAQARYTGQSDVPLNALGERQAEALGLRLANQRLDAIVSSDLQRARVTAEAIARHHDQPIQFDSDLREISLGEWEGLTYAEVLIRDPDRAAGWQADSLTIAPPGGETTIEFRDRLLRAFDRWRTAYPNETVLWVTHGGAIGILLCHLLGMDLERRWQFRRDNTAITEFDIGPNTGRHASQSPYYAILMRLNDTGHLAGIEDGHQSEERQVL
jgi:alpha-ribazole phosphatase